MQAIWGWLSWGADLLAKVPATFWGVVAGSFFTLIGITLTNQAASRRQRQELDHAMRKEVYLAAAEGISATLASFGRFPDPKLPFAKLAEVLNEKMPLISRAQLIAGADAWEHFTSLAFETATLFQRLILKRLPLAELQQQMDQLLADSDRALKGQDLMLEEMKQFNLADDQQSPQKWNIIRGNFDYEANRLGRNERAIKRLKPDLIRLQMDLAREAIVSVHALGRIGAQAVIAIRKELGVPIDEARYLATMEENYHKQIVELSSFQQSIEAALGNERHDNSAPEYQLGPVVISMQQYPASRILDE
jgi:hypothetical protein